MRPTLLLLLVLSCTSAFAQNNLVLAKTIYGKITPKSIVHSGNGLFFAQNMMYSHKITVYNRKFQLVKTIDDKVNPADFGFCEFDGLYKGAPVEAAASDSGKYMWVTNYQMTGDGFDKPGSDDCGSTGSFDSSFIYRINTETFKIDAVVRAGSVPKYIAATPDNRFVLVSNWCSGDVSVIDLSKLKEVKRIPLGLYPRGIAVDSKSQFAYVTIMGSDKIAKVSLLDFSVSMLDSIGKRPRHLCISSDDKFLFASLNAEHKVVKIDLEKQQIVGSVKTGLAPRSMALSPDNAHLYVVNYTSGTVSVVQTDSMKETQNLTTDKKPIGITYDAETNNVWVACYSGSIKVYKPQPGESSPPVASAQRTPVEKTAAAVSTGEYHIVVGAFREEKNANKMLAKCKKAGYSPYIIDSKKEMKIISCARLDEKAEALAELNKVRKEIDGKAWVHKE